MTPPRRRPGQPRAIHWRRRGCGRAARQIDLTIWSVAAIAGISIGLMMNSPPDDYRFAAIPETALGMFGVFFGILIKKWWMPPTFPKGRRSTSLRLRRPGRKSRPSTTRNRDSATKRTFGPAELVFHHFLPEMLVKLLRDHAAIRTGL